MTMSYGITWDGTGDRKGVARLLAVLLLAVAVVNPVAAPRIAAAGGALVGVIVRELPGAGDAPEREVERLGGEVGRQLAIIGGFAADVPTGAVAELQRSVGVAAVTVDARMRALGGASTAADLNGSMYNVNKAIGATELWKRNLTGKGIDIALIDTGIAPVEGLKTPGKVLNGPDLSFDSQADNLRYLDLYGHGTHMAGIIAGKDSDVPAQQQVTDPATGATYWDGYYHKDLFTGVAPDARLVNIKVGAADGGADISQAIAAIDWVVQHRNSNGMNIRVLNLSFGTDGVQSYLLDPLAYAAEVAWHKGIVVVVAAGNEGYGSAKLNNPAYDPFVIAVAAADMNDSLHLRNDLTPDFSSRGEASRRPDFSAPGKSIVSLRVPGSYADTNHSTARVGERFFVGSGTSQAAAVTSGAVALLLEQRPELTPDQVKRLIISSVNSMPYGDPDGKGAGEINLRAAADSATPSYVQTWERATGLGALDKARGSVRVQDEGVVLSGETTIFGTAWDSSDHALKAAAETTWSGGTWMGMPLAGDGWTGTSWSGDAWAGRSWSGSSWAGRSWSGRSWSGRSWSASGWTGDTWLGRSWSSDSWLGRSWSSGGWLGITWGGLRPASIFGHGTGKVSAPLRLGITPM